MVALYKLSHLMQKYTYHCFNKTKESRQVREMILGKLPKYIFLNKDEIFLNRDQILLNKDKIYLNKDQIFLNKNKIFLNRDKIFLVSSDGGTL